MTRPTTFLGIDPAFRKNGFAVCCLDMTDRTARFLTFHSPLDFYLWVISDEAPDPQSVVVCIENSNLQEQTFARYFQMQAGKIPSQAVLLAKSRDVGKNMAVSQITVDAAKRVYPGRVIDISPERKGRKWEYTHFQRYVQADRVELLGKVTKSEQDKIDAYQLASIAANQWAAFLNTRAL